MRCTNFLAAAVLISSPSVTLAAQTLPFSADTFFRREATARNLLAYDACGWRATDELLKHPRAELQTLGPLWVCLRNGSGWHAVFGTWDTLTNQFAVRFHYQLSGSSTAPATSPLDTTNISHLVRALDATLREAPPPFAHERIRFNPYVLQEPDSTLSVWLLPAIQKDNTAFFGAELHYGYSADGSRRLSMETIPGPLRGVRPDSTAPFRIDSNSPDSPSVGDIFFLLLMRPSMPRIRIQTPRFSSSLMKLGDGESWVHMVRDTSGIQ